MAKKTKIDSSEVAPILEPDKIEIKKRENKEKQNRINQVISCILRGMANKDIIEYFEAWGVTERTFYSYFQVAHEEIKKAHEINRDYEVANCKFQLTDLYSKAYNEADWKTCLAIKSKYIDFFGLGYDSKLEEAYRKIEKLEKLQSDPEHEQIITRHIVQVYSDEPETVNV